MKYNLSEITDVIKNRRTIYPKFFSSRKVHKEIVEHLSKNNILKNTLPGPIYSHSFHFFLSNEEKKYIITTDATNYIKKFQKKFFKLEKKFYLKEL